MLMNYALVCVPLILSDTVLIGGIVYTLSHLENDRDVRKRGTHAMQCTFNDAQIEQVCSVDDIQC